MTKIIMDFPTAVQSQIEKFGMKITRKMIANALNNIFPECNITEETVKKIINNPAHTTNRDRIIILCLLLNMNLESINNALYLHEMLGLCMGNVRDEIIISHINEYIDLSCMNNLNEAVIYDINKALSNMNYRPLSFKRNGDYSQNELMHEIRTSEYNIVDIRVDVDTFTYDRSISELYNVSKYLYYPYAKVVDDNKAYEIGGSEIYSFKIFNKNNMLLEEISRFDEKYDYYVNKFKKIIDYLEIKKRAKTEEVRLLINDTKNYYNRVHIYWDKGKLVLFAETFNYTNPLANDYAQIRISLDSFELFLSNESQYMREYLGNSYEKYYCKSSLEHKILTNNIKEINEINDEWIILFLKTSLKEFIKILEKIKNKKLIVFDSSNVIESKEDIFNFLGIDLHNVKYNKTINNNNNETQLSIEYKNSNIITSYEELIEVIEYGISYTDYIDIKQKYGSITMYIDYFVEYLKTIELLI